MKKKCRYGNCTAERSGINPRTNSLYAYCSRHRLYQSNYRKNKRKIGTKNVFAPRIDVLPLPTDAAKIKSLEKQVSKFRQLFAEVEKLKDKLNTLNVENVLPESAIRDMLAASICGKTEHVLPSGDRVDIVTEKAIYEVKTPDQYKAGLGQLCVYGQFFPKHKKILYLTKLCTPNRLEHILHDCQTHDIFVELHNN
jgi:hypothetical protein